MQRVALLGVFVLERDTDRPRYRSPNITNQTTTSWAVDPNQLIWGIDPSQPVGYLFTVHKGVGMGIIHLDKSLVGRAECTSFQIVYKSITHSIKHLFPHSGLWRMSPLQDYRTKQDNNTK